MKVSIYGVTPRSRGRGSRILVRNAVPSIITHPVGNIAVFKVVKDVRTLTKGYFNFCILKGAVLVLGGNHGRSCFTGSGKLQAFNHACICHRGSKIKARGINKYVVISTRCSNRQLNRSTIRHHCRIGRKCNLVGIYNSNSLTTDIRTFIH